MRLYDELLKRLSLAHRSLLELIEYQLPYTIILANDFFVDLDTTIQEQIASQYRTVLHCYSLRTHPDLLAERTFLDLEQSYQIHQDPDLERVSFYTRKE